MSKEKQLIIRHEHIEAFPNSFSAREMSYLSDKASELGYSFKGGAWVK
jgi:hypothetical protein